MSRQDVVSVGACGTRFAVAAVVAIPDVARVPQSPDPSAPEPLHSALTNFKKEFIRSTLVRCGGNRSYAATSLGIERTSLLRLIRELNIDDIPATPGGRAADGAWAS